MNRARPRPAAARSAHGRQDGRAAEQHLQRPRRGTSVSPGLHPRGGGALERCARERARQRRLSGVRHARPLAALLRRCRGRRCVFASPAGGAWRAAARLHCERRTRDSMPTYALALRNGDSVAVEFPHTAYECQARVQRLPRVPSVESASTSTVQQSLHSGAENTRAARVHAACVGGAVRGASRWQTLCDKRARGCNSSALLTPADAARRARPRCWSRRRGQVKRCVCCVRRWRGKPVHTPEEVRHPASSLSACFLHSLAYADARPARLTHRRDALRFAGKVCAQEALWLGRSSSLVLGH